MEPRPILEVRRPLPFIRVLRKAAQELKWDWMPSKKIPPPCTITDLCYLLRDAGWLVASHNDYPQDGTIRTYWSFSRNHQFIDADGKDDAEALWNCLLQAKAIPL